MARNTDRRKISEAVRLSPDWCVLSRSGRYVEYYRHNGIDQTRVIFIEFGNAEQVKSAKAYTVYNDTGSWDDFEYFTCRKRERVLEAITSKPKVPA